jgi:hypothetical protein
MFQTGVDFACRLGKLAPRRHFDGGAAVDRSVDRAGDDHHDAAFGYDSSREWRHELNAAGFAAAG